MVIPADLPALVAPVAWMLGTWEGWGMRAAAPAPVQDRPAEDAPTDAPVIEEIRGDVVGEQMRLVTRVYAGEASAPIDPTWDAAQGLAAIQKGDLISEETLYVSVAPSDAPLPPPGQYNPREFTATSASTEGHSAVWDGVSVGPRVQMVSDAIALGADATRLTHLGRMFGLVAGELMWTQERTLDGEDEADVEISGRLHRTEQASTDSGEVIDGIIDVDNSDPNPKRLPFEPDKMNGLLGLSLSDAEQQAYLEKLGFTVENGEVIVPSFRTDIARMCDLAEEVARMYGYDKIPTTLYAGEMVQGEYTPKQQAERAAALVCREAGFDESMTHSFISPKFYDMIGWAADDPRRISTTILNPLGEDFSIMRTTVLPSMLESLAHNHAHRNPTASLYELGTIYTPTVKNGKADPDVLPHEEKVLTLGSYGRLSFFQLKGVIEALCRELNIKGVQFVPEKNNPSYHPGRCASILAGGERIGVFGTVHPTVADRYGLSGEVLAAELRMDTLFAAIDSVKLYHPLPKFPASTRDIAVLVDDAVPAASMQASIEKAAGTILESVKLFDVYKGKGIPEGKKSVAYSLSLRAPDRTLTDEECDKAMKDALAALEKDFGAALRS